jgi:hypothetical protein
LDFRKSWEKKARCAITKKSRFFATEGGDRTPLPLDLSLHLLAVFRFAGGSVIFIH